MKADCREADAVSAAEEDLCLSLSWKLLLCLDADVTHETHPISNKQNRTNICVEVSVLVCINP